MSDNTKFFFRTEKIENEAEAYLSVPEDLEWAIDQGSHVPSGRTSSGSSGSLGPGGPSQGNGGGEAYDATYPFPNTKIDTPVIRGIVKQEVSQDPEGKGSIDVTFAVDDIMQGSVEWEIRVTR